MPELVQSIFIDPPIAIARVGGSTSPQDAYDWVQSLDPRADGETSIAPAWSLDVTADGSIQPRMPTAVTFRDDAALIRPVCPFFEVWALVGEPGSAPETWRETPLTTALLAQHGTDESALTIRVNAQNLKAARRTRNPNHGFGTRPPVEVRGNDHAAKVLFGISPADAQPPMIPAGRSIPLGSVQVLRTRPNQPGEAFSGKVNLEVIRLRFTPGRGRFFGPPQAAQATTQQPFPAVIAANAFLDPDAGWFGARTQPFVVPGDTYDVRNRAQTTGASLGVVDDTCEARIEVLLALPGSSRPLRALANAFCGPPDFGPDRRPFLSAADELNDRSADAAARSTAMTRTQRDAWVEDLFERVYETVSLLNIDFYRALRGIEQLSPDRLRPTPIAEGLSDPRRAMGGRDALRNELFTVDAVSDNQPLPLSEHARSRHRVLSDLQELRKFLAQSPGRLQALVRGPFEVEAQEDGNNTTMRMPPFMRQSNALPLTLAAWQYQLLIEWVAAAALEAVPVALAPAGVSDAANARRTAVLARLNVVGDAIA